MNWEDTGSRKEAANMTWIVRNGFLALVAIAPLTIMVVTVATS